MLMSFINQLAQIKFLLAPIQVVLFISGYQITNRYCTCSTHNKHEEEVRWLTPQLLPLSAPCLILFYYFVHGCKPVSPLGINKVHPILLACPIGLVSCQMYQHEVAFYLPSAILIVEPWVFRVSVWIMQIHFCGILRLKQPPPKSFSTLNVTLGIDLICDSLILVSGCLNIMKPAVFRLLRGSGNKLNTTLTYYHPLKLI